jgi:hypothetical protein
VLSLQKAEDAAEGFGFRRDPRTAAGQEQPGISLPPPQQEPFRQWSEGGQDMEWPASSRQVGPFAFTWDQWQTFWLQQQARWPGLQVPPKNLSNRWPQWLDGAEHGFPNASKLAHMRCAAMCPELWSF